MRWLPVLLSAVAAACIVRVVGRYAALKASHDAEKTLRGAAQDEEDRLERSLKSAEQARDDAQSALAEAQRRLQDLEDRCVCVCVCVV